MTEDGVVEDHPVFGIAIPDKGWVPAPRYLLRRHRLLNLLRESPRGEVLEIGCGAGALSRDLSRLGFRVQALDTSPAARELARELNGDDPSVQVCGEEDPAWESHFDYVLALEVLEHIVDDRAALEKWRSWLKPAGRLLLSVPSRQDRWNASDTWAGHIRRYERPQLRGLLEDVGFSVDTIECYGFPLANIIDPIRARHHGKLLNAQAGNAEPARQTAASGVERSLETRLWFLQSSRPGVWTMQAFCHLQGWFANTELGNGYLVSARRR